MLYEKWSKWSRCKNCKKTRRRKCISPKCHYSIMYEDRPCGNPRCRRRLKRKSVLTHIFQPENFEQPQLKNSYFHNPRIGWPHLSYSPSHVYKPHFTTHHSNQRSPLYEQLQQIEKNIYDKLEKHNGHLWQLRETEWSKWAPCNKNCTTKRYKLCFGKNCVNPVEQSAYCFAEGSECQKIVQQTLYNKYSKYKVTNSFKVS